VFDRHASLSVLNIVLALAMLGVCRPVEAGDVEDCRDAATLLQVDRSKPIAPAAAAACRRLAERGTASAQYSLGSIYLSGRGLPRDYKEAAKWLRKAADHGEADAQSDLGYMYAEGRGVPRTTRKRRSGSARPLTRAMSGRRAIWASCTPSAMECRRTIGRR